VAGDQCNQRNQKDEKDQIDWTYLMDQPTEAVRGRQSAVKPDGPEKLDKSDNHILGREEQHE
jgi:hypothetical protein